MRDGNIVITGGTSGMGKETASQLSKMGAQLLLIGRNRDKGEAAATDIMQASGSETVTFFQADLSLLREMHRTAGHIRQTFDQLDGFVHAAGGTFPQQRVLTDEGLEMSFAVDCLARYVLTNELLDLLRIAPTPKVLSIAGGADESKDVDFDNLNGEKSYSWSEAVARASATNDLLTMEQINRYHDVTFYNYGPGLVRTATIMGTLPGRLFFNTIGRLFSRSAEQAANDIVALLIGKFPSGFYVRSLKRNEPSAAKSDATRLWVYSEQLIDNLPT